MKQENRHRCGVWRRHAGGYGDPAAVDLGARRAFLKAARYAQIPQFAGTVIRTMKYSGNCYEVDGQYLAVEPIIEPAAGFHRGQGHAIFVVHL